MGDRIDLGVIELALQQTGLTPRGAFHPATDDAVPPIADGTPAQSRFHMQCFPESHRPGGPV